MDASQFEEETDLLKALQQKDIKAFKRFYKEYRDDLIIFTFCQVHDVELAYKAVDQLFERLWQEGDFQRVHPPIYKFLLVEMRKLYTQ